MWQYVLDMRSRDDVLCSVQRLAPAPYVRLAICGALVISCTGAGGDTSTNPTDGARANLRLDRVTFAQATQDASASIPMIEGAAAVAIVGSATEVRWCTDGHGSLPGSSRSRFAA